MATVAFAAAAAWGASAGGYGVVASAVITGIGTAAGAYIDQAFLFPAVFGRKGQTIEGARLDDRQIMTASEGAMMNRIYGVGRCAGNLIWAAPIEEIQNKESSGGGKGGGGGGVSSTTYEYRQSCAIGICEGPIAKIDQVWADGKLIYQQGGFRNLLKWSDAFQQSAWTRNNAGMNYNVAIDLPPEESGYGTFYYVDRLRVSNTKVQLGQKRVRVNPNTTYTLSFWCHTGQVDGPKLTIWDDSNDMYIIKRETYTPEVADWGRITRTFTTPDDCWYLDVYIVDQCDARDTHGAFYLFGAQLEAGSEATDYDRTEGTTFALDPQYDGIDFYVGSESQTVNSTMEAHEGAGEVPAYRGLAYVVFRRLKLQNFGNRIPQFTFQVAEDRSRTVKETIEDICLVAGFTGYNVDGLGAGRMRGMMIEGPQVPAKLLEQIMIPYGIMSNENNGSVRFFPRGEPEPSDYTRIPDGSLGAHEEGEESLRRVKFSDVAGTELPTEVIINYYDYDNQFQKGSTRERRRQTTIPNVLSMDFPFVWGADTARTVAKRLLWDAWGGRVTAEFMVGPELIHLQEGDPIQFSISSDTYYCRITEITDGANFIRAIKAVVENARPLATRATSTTLIIPQPTPVYQPSDLFMVLADTAALREQDTTGPGFYVGAAMIDQTQLWRGAALYTSTDGTLYSVADSLPQQATVGVTTTVLATGPENVWDRIHTVTVVLKYGTLESVSEDAVLQGTNWLLIGGELVGFANAVLIGTRTYTLSNLIRGMRGSIGSMGTHAIGEEVMLVSGPGVRFVAVPNSLLNQSRRYKPVPVDVIVDEVVQYETFATTGNTLRPFPPAAVTGTRDGSNNLTIAWQRTTRSIASVFGPTALVQLSDELNNYSIDIIVASAVVRTITVTAAITTVYSAANQTSDGITPGNPVTLDIYQISSVIGRGFKRRITI